MTHKILALLLAGMAVQLAAAPIAAQTQSPLVKDARIRVTAPEIAKKKMVGTVALVFSDTISFKIDRADTMAIVPLMAVERLEISRGQKSKFVLGAGIGFLIGAIIGAIAVEGSGETSDAAAKGMSAGFFGILGGALGGLMGSSTKVDLWEEIPLEQWQTEITLRRCDKAILLGTLTF